MLRLFNRAPSENGGRAGVSLGDSRVGLARIARTDDDRLSLAACAFRLEEEDSPWPTRAESRISRMDLRQATVSAVLPHDAYQLQLVETPNVPAEEMRDAVRWRIKDFIDYPVEDAVIELFEMPLQTNRGTKPSGYAVVSDRSEILDQIDHMREAGLRMDVIDIPEFCMRNIAGLLPQDRDGIAFLHLTDTCGYLTITRQRVLHLIRRIETGRRAIAEAIDHEFMLQERSAGIALEVQRSLDYYESHYDCQPISELIVGPGAGLEVLPAALAKNLALRVSQIDLSELLDIENELSPEEAGNCLFAIGAALRIDEAEAMAETS